MLGDALLETGHPEKALPQYEKVIKLDPDYMSALGSKAYCLLLLERYEEALRCYEVVSREVDDDHEYWNCMGVTLHHLQRDDEALDCYQKALDLKPDYLLALRNMADVYLKYKQCDTAEELYLKAYRIGNRPADLFAATLCMYMTHRYEEMVQPLLSLLPVAKEEGLSVAYRLAVAYKNLHQYEEAIRYYKLQMETSQDGSDNSACWFQLALCEKKLKHLDEAENSMKKALELFDSDEEKAMCHFSLGELYLERKQYTQALDHFDQAAALDPEIDDYAEARKVALSHVKRNRK